MNQDNQQTNNFEEWWLYEPCLFYCRAKLRFGSVIERESLLTVKTMDENGKVYENIPITMLAKYHDNDEK